MKKLLFAIVLAVAGYVLYRKVSEEREERDLWAEVTDSFGEPA